jgi:siroheme synthase-like protein
MRMMATQASEIDNSTMPMETNKQSSPVAEGNLLYPIFLKLDRLDILLVGAGNVGLEKLESLLGNSPGAQITVVAPMIRDEVYGLVSQYPQVRIVKRDFEERDLDGRDLVVLATDNKPLHVQIREMARNRHILLNVADTPDLCDFYLGSIVRKGNLKIAISTNGKSPTVAKRLKQVLQESLPDEMDSLLQQVNKIRDKIGGDFNNKVKKLNDLTKSLVEDEESASKQKWFRLVRNSSLAFIFMVVGYFFFTYVPLRLLADGAIDWYGQLDANFKWILLAGFVAQMVDGALGMGYGVASSSILLSTGVNPAAISGSIHTAEIFASGASGISHYKFGNVNMKLFWRLVLPGVLGAVLGAVMLVYMGEHYSKFIRPVIAVYTLLLGIKFIYNAFRTAPIVNKFKRYSLLAAVGGFFDSFGGGGWGPIVTTTLINGGRSHRYTVGTVSLTEFFVTFASALTFFQLIGIGHWQTILALILGGFVAAPFAAKLAGKLPRKTASVLLGILVIFWSIRIIVKIF